MRKRIAIVEKEKCHPHNCPGTYYCIKVCPINRMGKECITKDETDGKIKIDEDLASDACRICVRSCPFGAIHLVNLPEKLNEEPIHRYGQNKFELFRLPLPKKGTIVGILGRNGIGKSTALGILTGTLKPNLGNYDEETTEEAIISLYSKTLLGQYFQDLYGKTVKISYKPQRIELLSRLYNGKVIELINQIDETQQGEQLLKDLNLWHLKERDIDKLSGGELQRLAIVAALVKQADFYYFDEPASFLDITSRIKVAKLIRNIKDASVVVVEHDLATLDYISDEIQIVYGEQACYGIFTPSKAVKRGINEYLDGYLEEDNVRFRNYKIHFHKQPATSDAEPTKLLEFPELKKQYDTFKLNVNPGILNKGEVLAIMGANGLGKTTMLKLLAGIEKPDNCKLDKLDIAYKPQSLETEEGTVQEYLMKAAGKNYSSGWYKQNILEKLNIQSILNNDMQELSGGELQKVYVAATLSTDAPLIALDEPSAFVDVEDRLHLAEVIREFTEKRGTATIVVDHDVQFIDYVGDKMLVFEGTPGTEGHVYGPCSKAEGMNRVLKMLDITYRKDQATNRARINKPGSQLDQEQRKRGIHYAV